jgi:hypothetical protein
VILLGLGLALAGDISGVVTDGDGRFVVGASVIVYDQRLNYAIAESTIFGRFSFQGLPDNPYRLRVIPGDDRNLVEQWVGGDLDLCAGLTHDLGDVSGLSVVLESGGIISGTLLDAAGEPVVGAVVKSRSGLPNPVTLPRTAITDETGAFRMLGMPPEGGTSGTYLLEVEHENHPDQYLDGRGTTSYDEVSAGTWEVMPAEEVLTNEHILTRGVQITGSVTGPDGPVDVASVSVYSPSQIRSVPVVDGEFTASGLPPGEVLVWVAGEGLATTYYPSEDRPKERISVLLEDEVARADLLAVASARLEGQLEGQGDLSEASVLLYNSDRTVGFTGDVLVDGSFVIEALHPGAYTLLVTGAAAGYVDDFSRDADGDERVYEVPAEGLVGVKVPLSPASEIHGTVRDKYTETLVYGASVYAESRSTGKLVVATTDQDGTYTLSGLVEDDWLLWAEYGAYCLEDPDWISSYYPDHVNHTLGGAVALIAGESLLWDPTLRPDGDHDGMDDVWEEANGLDPTVADGEEDPDGDGFTNREEYLLGTDPLFATTGSGCGGGCRHGAPWMAWLGVPLLLRRRRAGCTIPAK